MTASGEKSYAELQAQLDGLRDLERKRSVAKHDASMAQADTARVGMIALFVVAVMASILVTVTLSRMISGSITRLTASTIKLADGDLTVQVEGGERQDEIGVLAGAIGVFRSNAIDKRRIEEEQRVLQHKASTRQGAVEQHIAAFEIQVRNALETLGAASVQMRGTSDGMSGTAERTNDQVAAVAAASREASSNVQTVAAASEELGASISEISRQVSNAATIAGRAVDEAHQTDLTVQGLAEVVAGIRDVVKLISDIAGQTNLLALNATIEAARAGESGRGFAVVASEVKSLATQTAKATGEIAAQIDAVQNVTRETVEAMKRIGGTISEVSSVATSIASAVEEQGAATMEITRSTQQAAARTQEVSDHIAGVSEGAKNTDDAAHGVKSAAEALNQETERLRGHEVWARGGLTSVGIYEDYKLVALHPRAKEPGERHTILAHLPPEKVPGLTTTRESCAAEAAAIGPDTAEVVRRLLADKPVDRLPSAKRLLKLAKRYGALRLERACGRAVQFDDPSTGTVRRILEKGLDLAALPPMSVAVLEAPQFARSADELWPGLGGVSWN